MIKLILRSAFLLLCFVSGSASFAQSPPLSFYLQDSFNGGVTAGGYGPDYSSGGTGYFKVNIPPGSTIRKAYLLIGNYGPSDDITITLNTLSLNVNSATPLATSIFTTEYGSSCDVVYLDLTSQLSDTAQYYTITVPTQPGPDNRYEDFYLYIAYNNPSMPVVNTAIFLNNFNIATTINYSPMQLTYPYVKPGDFGISIWGSYLCNDISDGENIYLGSDTLGLIGGPDINCGSSCGSTLGSFYYNSGTLHGLSDDSDKLKMNGSDALSNASSLIPTNTTSISMSCTHQGNSSYDNDIWGIILAYGTSTETNIEQAYYNGRLKIFPIPTTGNLTVAYHSLPLTQINIENVLGQLVLTKQIDNTTATGTENLDVSAMPAGIYFIQLQTAGSSWTQKFVKE